MASSSPIFGVKIFLKKWNHHPESVYHLPAKSYAYSGAVGGLAQVPGPWRWVDQTPKFTESHSELGRIFFWSNLGTKTQGVKGEG